MYEDLRTKWKRRMQAEVSVYLGNMLHCLIYNLTQGMCIACSMTKSCRGICRGDDTDVKCKM
jgi:hypothetical protein